MEEKSDFIDYFKNTPKKKLSEIDKQIVFILLEKSKIQRERAHATVNKVFSLFCILVVLAFVGKFNNAISNTTINLTFIFGIFILIIISAHFEQTMRKEEKSLNQILESFTR